MDNTIAMVNKMVTVAICFALQCYRLIAGISDDKFKLKDKSYLHYGGQISIPKRYLQHNYRPFAHYFH